MHTIGPERDGFWQSTPSRHCNTLSAKSKALTYLLAQGACGYMDYAGESNIESAQESATVRGPFFSVG
jgi:hypothetical protein